MPVISQEKGVRRRRSGRIGADSAVDRKHLENREFAKSLWVILLFVFAFAACLVVTWFLNDRMLR